MPIGTAALRARGSGAKGHFGRSPYAWANIGDLCVASMAHLVGALPHEIVVMNSLTVNLHLLLVSFYRPSATRYKIIMEGGAFPSDTYALESQVRFHGYDPATAIVRAAPRPDAVAPLLLTADIIDLIRVHGPTTALVFFGGVQYYTGQLLDMPAITRAAHEQASSICHRHRHHCCCCYCSRCTARAGMRRWLRSRARCRQRGARAARLGRRLCVLVHVQVPQRRPRRHCGRVRARAIHDARRTAVAAICRLVGPRPVAALRHAGRSVCRRVDIAEGAHIHCTAPRYRAEFVPAPGAARYALSNPSMLQMIALHASLELFLRTSMRELRAKSELLTGYLEYLLQRHLSDRVEILTPRDPRQRGCQISLCLKACHADAGRDGIATTDHAAVDRIMQALAQRGVICDVRRPNALRLAPVPLYNTFEDVWRCVEALRAALG